MPFDGGCRFLITNSLNLSSTHQLPIHIDIGTENFSCRLNYGRSKLKNEYPLFTCQLSAIKSCSVVTKIEFIESSIGYEKQRQMKSTQMKDQKDFWTIDWCHGRDERYGEFPHMILVYTKAIKKGQMVLLEYVESLSKDHSLADIKFLVNGHEFPAHYLIVSGSSPVLATMFQSDFEEKQTRIVTIEDTTADIFKLFLNYLYSGDFPTASQEDVLVGLFQLADKYEVTSLKEEIVPYLVQGLKVENAVRILIVSHLFSSTNLYDKTLAFISKNSVAICRRADWLHLIRQYPELCFNTVKFIVSKK